MKILKILLLVLTFSWTGVYAQQLDSSNQDLASLRIFPTQEFKAIYKTKIQFKDKSFSGLLLIRRNADSTFRIAFVTEVGMKIFEFMFYPKKENGFKVISILPYLDKKIIVKTLRKDFESVFMTFASFKKPKIKVIEENLIKLKYCYQGKRIYAVQPQDSIRSMKRKCVFLKKEEIQLKYGSRNIVESISIQHFGVDLAIDMLVISEN